MGAKHSQLTLWRSCCAGLGGREGGPAGGRGGVASLSNAGGAVPTPPPPHCPPESGDPGCCCSEPTAGAAARSGCPGPPGAGRLMSWVEKAQRGPAPSLRPRPGRSGRGLGAGWGWRLRRFPHLLAGGEARGPGASSAAPCSHPDSCLEAEHAPRQPHLFRLFQLPLLSCH